MKQWQLSILLLFIICCIVHCKYSTWVISLKHQHKIDELNEKLQKLCLLRNEYPPLTVQNIPNDWVEIRLDPNCHNERIRGLLSAKEVEETIKEEIGDKLNFIYYQEPHKRTSRGSELKDPYYKHQWHLHNNNNDTTIDVDVLGVWKRGILGKGVVIAIVDNGMEINHPEIQPNYNKAGSWDFVFNNADPTSPNYHGTSCAGVAAAASNNHCGVGVAYKAQLSGIRLITNSLATDYDESKALVYQYNINDIYSCSWGPIDDGYTAEGPGPLAIASIRKGVIHGRNGKGSIYVWAAGNGLKMKDNCNYDGYVNLIQTIGVGAVDNFGKQSYYSEPGASMLICAPSSSSDVFIITSDLTGSDGVSNSECNKEFGGTSSACPLVAGIIALMLEENPKLGWRDVQYILIKNALKNDPEDSDWTLNSGGYHINHKYGFGLVDAFNSVLTARLWVNVPPSKNITSKVMVKKEIPDNNGKSLTSTFEVMTSGTVEHVELNVNIDHPQYTDLEITLTSPSGTVSILSENHGYSTSAKLETLLPNGVIFTATGTWVTLSALLGDDITAPLGITQPSDSCNPAKGYLGDNLNGKIVLVKKGNCLIQQKLKALRKLNPIAVVIYDNKLEDIYVIEEPGEATIPVGFISKTDGELLVNLLMNGTELEGTLYNSTSKHRVPAVLNNWTFMTVRNWGENAMGVWSVSVTDLDGPSSVGIWNSYTLTIHTVDLDAPRVNDDYSELNNNDGDWIWISVFSGVGGLSVGILIVGVLGVRFYRKKRRIIEFVDEFEMEDLGGIDLEQPE